jgi:hypothetical protein
MGRKTETRTIDGFEVTTTQFASVAGCRLWTRLLPMFLPALAALPDGQNLNNFGQMDLAKLAPALGAIAAKLTPDEFETTMLEVLALTQVTYGRGNQRVNRTLDSVGAIDAVFDGAVGSIFKVMWFALEVNFDSFGIAGALRQSAAPAVPTGATA